MSGLSGYWFTEQPWIANQRNKCSERKAFSLIEVQQRAGTQTWGLIGEGFLEEGISKLRLKVSGIRQTDSRGLRRGCPM